MNKALDIGAVPIAEKVQRHLLTSYCALQLDALQIEAKRYGYFFTHAETAASMAPFVEERLAWAVEHQHQRYLRPNCPESWERHTEVSMRNGSAQEHCRSMLAALATLGIRLQDPLYEFPTEPDVTQEENPNMTKAADIDLDLSLLAEGRPETIPNQHGNQPKRKGRIPLRIPVIVAGALLVLLGIATRAYHEEALAMLAEDPEKNAGIPFLQEAEPQPQRLYTHTPDRFCSGFEIMCSTSTTESPAETLAKLANALPVENAKRYRVRVSVVSADED